MKKHLCLLLLFLLVFRVYTNAQPEKKAALHPQSSKIKILPEAQVEIDSLKKLIKTTPKGKTKIELYGQLYFTYASTLGNVDLAREYADSIKLLAKELTDENALTSLDYYYGMFARYDGKYQEAFDHLNKQIEYCETSGDSSVYANTLYQMALVQMFFGNYDKSLAFNYRAIELYEKKSFSYGVAMTLMNVGILLAHQKNYDDAINTYNKSLTILKGLKADLNVKINKLRLLINIADAYSATKQYGKARRYYNQSLLISASIGSKRTQATTLSSIGEILNKTGHHDSALVFHLQSLSIREETSQKDRIIISLVCVGETYTYLNDYFLAKQYLLKALSFSKEFKAKPEIRNAYEKLSKLYAIQGNFQKAYEYHQLFSVMKDSILNEATAKQLNELQTEYETVEKDKKITFLAKEKEFQRTETLRQSTLKKAYSAGLVMLSLLIILLLYIFHQRLKHQKLLNLKNDEIKDVNFKRQVSELEMKSLRAQINPHFLFNCMNSINRMILNGETDNASLYLTKFSKLVRLILENAEAASVSLENELALLESYIQLEELRFKGKISYRILIDESIECDSTYLPSMVLQPFIENAIWHGIMHKEKDTAGMITIAVREDNDWLLCTIEDNGVGREKARQLRERSVLNRKSLGIKITEERLRMLGHENPERFIRITDLKDTFNHASGTRVEISIPIS